MQSEFATDCVRYWYWLSDRPSAGDSQPSLRVAGSGFSILKVVQGIEVLGESGLNDLWSGQPPAGDSRSTLQAADSDART